jgi:hypothetical protein
MDAIVAEVEAETADGSTLVELVTEQGSAEIHVPPPGRWKTSANMHMNGGNYEVWARSTLPAEDYKAWSRLDPNVDDAQAFLLAWQTKVGEDLGKSRSSQRSSRSTARR